MANSIIGQMVNRSSMNNLLSSCFTSIAVNVDGVDWTGVKFFQLTAQWQTHIKTFPVASFGILNENCSILSSAIPKANRI